MKHIFLFLVFLIISLNSSYLVGKILPPTPAEIERQKELEAQKELKAKTDVKSKQAKSIQDNLPSRAVESSDSRNVSRDSPSQNKNLQYDNAKDLSDIDINSNARTDTSSTTTEFLDDGYELPKVDNDYVLKTKDRITQSRSFINDPLMDNVTGAPKYFSESDLERYNDLVNPYSFKLLSYPAIVRLRTTSQEDSNIEAMLHSGAPQSKIFDFKLLTDVNLSSYLILNHLIYRAPNTIFVAEYDKKSEIIAVKTKSLHYMFIPNNGMLSLINATVGIIEIRKVNLYAYLPMFKNSEYAYYYLVSRLASGQINFSAVGSAYPKEDLVIDNYPNPQMKSKTLSAGIIFIDDQSNIITNASKKMFDQLDLLIGDDVNIIISKGNQVLHQEKIKYQEDLNTIDIQSTLGFTKVNLMYLHLKQGINLKAKGIKYGEEYNIKIIKIK